MRFSHSFMSLKILRSRQKVHTLLIICLTDQIQGHPSDGSVQEGIPLNPVIHVYSEDDTGICSLLKERCVDIWHANSEGVYSAVSDQGTTNMDLQI